MTEKLAVNSEQVETLQQTPEYRQALPTAAQAEALRPGETDPHKLDTARNTVYEIPAQENPLERFEATEKAAMPVTSTYIDPELKSLAVKRQLQSIRRKLPLRARVASKIIHQPFIRATSEVASKTASRPSGLLGGGLVAFLGTTSYLYLAKHFGFSYNYAVFFVLFVGGFTLGLLLELCVHWATTSHRHSS